MVCDVVLQKQECSTRRMSVLEQSQQEVSDQRLNDHKDAVIRSPRHLVNRALLKIAFISCLVNCLFKMSIVDCIWQAMPEIHTREIYPSGLNLIT